jgi:hypothetical protein
MTFGFGLDFKTPILHSTQNYDTIFDFKSLGNLGYKTKLGLNGKCS